MSTKLVIFGAGGHARVVANAIQAEKANEITFFADIKIPSGSAMLAGRPIRSEADGFAAGEAGVKHAFVAIGSNALRARVASQVLEAALELIVVVHPSAMLASEVRIGAGTFVSAGAILNPNAVVGRNSIVNTAAVIEHDCRIGDNCHVGPGAVLCGGVHVGDGSLVGAGATVLVGVEIGANAVIGAGATVLNNVPPGARVVGTRGRLLD